MPQLPGQTCTLPAYRVQSQAALDQRPQIEIRSPFGAPMQVQILTSARNFYPPTGFFELSAGERASFAFYASIRGDAKAGSYGPIEFVVRLPDARGIYVEVKRFTLIDKISVQRALEMAVEKFDCGTLLIGEECRIFRGTVQNHAAVLQHGRLEVILQDVQGRRIGKPAGVQLLQKCEGEERRPLDVVSVEARKTKTCDVFLLVSQAAQGLEIASFELVLREL